MRANVLVELVCCMERQQVGCGSMERQQVALSFRLAGGWRSFLVRRASGGCFSCLCARGCCSFLNAPVGQGSYRIGHRGCVGIIR